MADTDRPRGGYPATGEPVTQMPPAPDGPAPGERASAGQALPRCMGGRFCRHTPGTCTATAPPRLGEPFTAVALPAPRRDPEDERQARAVAFGLYALDAPLGSSVHRGWDQLTPERRDLYVARARLVLSMAQDLL